MCFSLYTGADINVTGTVSDEAPIHTALKSSSARCVKEIIQMYPKQLHTQVGPSVITTRTRPLISDFIFLLRVTYPKRVLACVISSYSCTTLDALKVCYVGNI